MRGLLQEFEDVVVRRAAGASKLSKGQDCAMYRKLKRQILSLHDQMLEALQDVDSTGAMECCCGETPCCGSCTATLVRKAIEAATCSP